MLQSGDCKASLSVRLPADHGKINPAVKFSRAHREHPFSGAYRPKIGVACSRRDGHTVQAPRNERLTWAANAEFDPLLRAARIVGRQLVFKHVAVVRK